MTKYFTTDVTKNANLIKFGLAF